MTIFFNYNIAIIIRSTTHLTTIFILFDILFQFLGSSFAGSFLAFFAFLSASSNQYVCISPFPWKKFIFCLLPFELNHCLRPKIWFRTGLQNKVKLTLTSMTPLSSMTYPPFILSISQVVLLIWILSAADKQYKSLY